MLTTTALRRRKERVFANMYRKIRDQKVTFRDVIDFIYTLLAYVDGGDSDQNQELNDLIDQIGTIKDINDVQDITDADLQLTLSNLNLIMTNYIISNNLAITNILDKITVMKGLSDVSFSGLIKRKPAVAVKYSATQKWYNWFAYDGFTPTYEPVTPPDKTTSAPTWSLVIPTQPATPLTTLHPELANFMAPDPTRRVTTWAERVPNTLNTPIYTGQVTGINYGNVLEWTTVDESRVSLNGAGWSLSALETVGRARCVLEEDLAFTPTYKTDQVLDDGAIKLNNDYVNNILNILMRIGGSAISLLSTALDGVVPGISALPKIFEVVMEKIGPLESADVERLTNFEVGYSLNDDPQTVFDIPDLSIVNTEGVVTFVHSAVDNESEPDTSFPYGSIIGLSSGVEYPKPGVFAGARWFRPLGCDIFLYSHSKTTGTGSIDWDDSVTKTRLSKGSTMDYRIAFEFETETINPTHNVIIVGDRLYAILDNDGNWIERSDLFAQT
jgi:hypothetical protein